MWPLDGTPDSCLKELYNFKRLLSGWSMTTHFLINIREDEVGDVDDIGPSDHSYNGNAIEKEHIRVYY